MSLLINCSAAVCAAIAAWLVHGALAVQSAAPEAPKVGALPPLWELGALTAIALVLVTIARPARDRIAPLYITALCIIPWLPGVRTPALLAWTGPLGAMVLLAAAAAVTATWLRDRVGPWISFADSRRAPLLAAVLSLVFFGIVAYGARESVPGGDEPHYLIITQSLLKDGDLQIENNHARGDYAAYFRGNLRPDYFVRGQNGAIYSIHAPGLPVLIAPAFAVGGYRGVVVLLLICAAAGMGLAWHLAFTLTRSAPAAWFGTTAMAVATPVAFHSFTVYPDGLAAVLLLTGVWALMRLIPGLMAAGRSRVWALHGVALAFLPWLHTRFAVLSGLLAIVILMRMPRTRDGLARAAAFLVLPVISAIAWFAFFYVVYGTPNPNAPYGTFMKSQSSLRFVSGGLAGLFFDQQFGILLYAPVFAIAAVGYIVLARRWPRLALELAVVSLPYFIAITNLRMWWGGWSAPARFAVPVLLQGSFLAAFAWSAARTRAARATAVGALLVSAFTTVALAFVDGGRLAYNVRDGYALWLEWLSPLADLPLGLPSFFRWLNIEWAMDLQMLFVLMAFVAAYGVLRCAERRFAPGRGAIALLLLALNAAAAMATLTVLWHVNDATGLRPAASEIRLLRAAAARGGSGLLYEHGVRRVSTDGVVSSLRIESPPRLVGGADPPALVAPGWIPAGDYEIPVAAAKAGAPSSFEIRTMRLDRPIADGSFSGTMRIALRLPVDVPAILVRGGNLAPATLVPIRVARHDATQGLARATAGQRYGAIITWFLDANAFVEPDGFWVRGMQSAEVIMQPLAADARQIALHGRNGAAANRMMLETEKWHEQVSLAPGQEFDVSVPLESAGRPCRLRITSPAGFRPSEVERGSTDRRLLGVWTSPR